MPTRREQRLTGETGAPFSIYRVESPGRPSSGRRDLWITSHCLYERRVHGSGLDALWPHVKCQK